MTIKTKMHKKEKIKVQFPPPKVSLLDVVVGLAWSYDPEGYASGKCSY
jgi:hypothetical protein